MRERYRFLVTTLENIYTAWKIIPKAAIEPFKQKNPILKALGAIKVPISLLEFLGQVLFFYTKPYWEQCVFAIWRLYWALLVDKNPWPSDVAIVGALYFRERDRFVAARKLREKLGKKWPLIREEIEKEKLHFKPDQSIQTETFKFLRFAATDLVDLYLKDELPMVCLAHHRVHWSECPECRTLREKEGEELDLEGEE